MPLMATRCNAVLSRQAARHRFASPTGHVGRLPSGSLNRDSCCGSVARCQLFSEPFPIESAFLLIRRSTPAPRSGTFRDFRSDCSPALLIRVVRTRSQIKAAVWASRRPHGKARGARIQSVCKRGATQPGGMHRRADGTFICERVLTFPALRLRRNVCLTVMSAVRDC